MTLKGNIVTGERSLNGQLPGELHFGVPGPQGPAGPAGDDYVLTDADKAEIAEMAADLVKVPDTGGNVDVTIDGETLVIAENSTATIDGETLIL